MYFKVIENFLPDEEHNKIKDIVSNASFPWYYNDRVASIQDTQNFYFKHEFYLKDIFSDYFNDCIKPILRQFKKPIKVFRAKANLFTVNEKNIAHGFHNDVDFEHTNFIYSINTNDGYTEFESGQKIPSVEKQLLIFDGKFKHRSVAQTNTKTRINFNINAKESFKDII